MSNHADKPLGDPIEIALPAHTAGGDTRRLLYTWYLVGLLIVAYTFSFIDRQILSLMVEPMKRDLEISDTQMSLLQGLSFALFYSFMGLPLGRFADNHSRRGLIAAGISLWSLMTATCGVVTHYWHLFLARMGVGVGEAALSPAAYSLIADSVEERNLGKAISCYTMGIYLGAGLALIIGGMVITWTETLGTVSLPLIGVIHSWQLVFLCVGLPGFGLALMMFTINEPKRRMHSRKHAIAPNASVADVLTFFKRHKGTIVYHNFGSACASLAGYGALAWVPAFLMRQHGLSSSEVGLTYGLIVLFCGGGGAVFGGWWADRWLQKGHRDAKIRVAMISALLGIVPAALYPLMPNLSLLFALLAIATFLTNSMIGLAPAAIQEVVPSTMRGQFSALYLFVANLIGLGVGPTAVALCTDYVFGGPEYVGYSLAIVPCMALFISAALMWRCMPRYRATREELESEY